MPRKFVCAGSHWSPGDGARGHDGLLKKNKKIYPVWLKLISFSNIIILLWIQNFLLSAKFVRIHWGFFLPPLQ
jgi:hypothetical protein